jgi:hypothetical protein
VAKRCFVFPNQKIMTDQKGLLAAIENLDKSVDDLDLTLKVSTKIKADIKANTQSRVIAMDKLTQELRLKLGEPQAR